MGLIRAERLRSCTEVPEFTLDEDLISPIDNQNAALFLGLLKVYRVHHKAQNAYAHRNILMNLNMLAIEEVGCRVSIEAEEAKRIVKFYEYLARRPPNWQQSRGITNISSHLIKVHSIDIVSSQAAKVISRQTSIKEAMARGQETSYKRRRLAKDPDTERTIDPTVLEHLYVRWITACGVPFRMVSREEFRALLYYLNPEVDVWLPDSHMLIQAWTLRTYENERLRVQQKV
ncbi:hypothetical protein G7Y89_g13067 [Cudoniella acicularis]|uniref:Uncharacterized protein n=1 Tax=Cudoniella acicularis TaxID=354080 RepID=A0A8H4RA05_9HELO|nr:hypothetical protein G7Y89_g13067 [Cudoniella acicularis]